LTSCYPVSGIRVAVVNIRTSCIFVLMLYDYDALTRYTAPGRLAKYLHAVQGDKTKAAALYRLNLELAKEMFVVISMFEVILRNEINNHFKQPRRLNSNWIYDAVQPNGFLFSFKKSKQKVEKAIGNGATTNDLLVSRLDFGFWNYLFQPNQYRVAGGTLLNIFTQTPRYYTQQHVFDELNRIRDFRNRIAHHEPLCIVGGSKSASALIQQYTVIQNFMKYLNRNPTSAFYNLPALQIRLNELNNL
jgi:Abi-like protein